MLLKPVQFAIVKFEGIRPLARAINIDSAYVHRWRESGLIPSKHQIDIIEASNNMITPKEIIYGGDIDKRVVVKNFEWLLKDA